MGCKCEGEEVMDAARVTHRKDTLNRKIITIQSYRKKFRFDLSKHDKVRMFVEKANVVVEFPREDLDDLLDMMSFVKEANENLDYGE
jgi:hypothetical protein